MNVGQLLKDFGSNLLAEFKAVLSAIGTFVTSFFTTFDNIEGDIEGIHADVLTIISNVELEMQKLKSFQFNVKWKTRVINVPIAVEQIKALIDEITHQLVDKIKEVERPIAIMIESLKANRRDPSDANKPSALAVVTVSVTTIENGIKAVRASISSLKDVTSLFIDITDRIEGLDDFFLQQGNSRMRLTEKSTIRLGALHADVG